MHRCEHQLREVKQFIKIFLVKLTVLEMSDKVTEVVTELMIRP